MHDHEEFLEPDDEEHDRAREAVRRAEDAARSCGLYLEDATILIDPNDRKGPLLVQARLRVGELAFSARVLDPATEETNKTFREMDADMEADSMREIRERLTRGEGAIGDLEKDE